METKTKPGLIKSVEKDERFMAEQLRKPNGSFAEIVGNQMNNFNEVLYEFVIDLMQLKDHENILEIGFGNGKFFNKLFNKNGSLKIKGIDFSKEMVHSAELYNQQAISNGKLKLYLGNSEKLPFPDNSFDEVFCNMVIYFWEEPEKHLKEIRRVLKSNGKFFAGLRTKESTLRFPFAKYGFIFYEPNEWKIILEKCGFLLSGINKKLERPINFKGQNLRLESICYVAE